MVRSFLWSFFTFSFGVCPLLSTFLNGLFLKHDLIFFLKVLNNYFFICSILYPLFKVVHKVVSSLPLFICELIYEL